MQSRPHIIRLREPWETATQAVSPAASRVTLRRRFNRPTGLDAQSRIVLVIAGLPQLAAVTLNTRPLVGSAPSQGDWQGQIPADLPAQNTLQIDLEACQPTDLEAIRLDVLAAGKVRLEIHDCSSPAPLDARTAL